MPDNYVSMLSNYVNMRHNLYFMLTKLSINFHNMSYGATVGASAANSNLIEFKKKVLHLSWINPMCTVTFHLWFFDYLKNAYEFKLYVCCWYLEFTSVDLLPCKIKIFDRLTCTSTVIISVMLKNFNLQLGGCKYKIYNMTTEIFWLTPTQ